MLSEKMSLGLAILGLFCSTIALGETYRCVNSAGMFEFTNRPCTSGGALAPAPAPPSITEVDSYSSSQRGDGSTCPMILAPKPEPSGSRDSRDQQLDQLEAQLYGDARAGRIHWTRLVDQFYTKCAELYPGYHRNDLVEVSAYQRVLAEKMDSRSITESEWRYLLETQAADIRARGQIIENSRQRPTIIQNSTPRSTNCTTTEFMGTYRTHCD